MIEDIVVDLLLVAIGALLSYFEYKSKKYKAAIFYAFLTGFFYSLALYHLKQLL